MTYTEIEKGNAIIAEFMGYEYIPEDKDEFAWANHGWWLKGMYHLLINAFNNKYWLGFTTTLRYHNDWNWLMSVVEKMEIQDFEMSIRGISTTVYNKSGEKPYFQPHNIGKTKIEAVWLAIIEFIKWYNSIKDKDIAE